MLIQGRIDSTPSGNIELESKNEEAVIDIKKKLIYFPEENVVKKIKTYSLKFEAQTSKECINMAVLESTSKISVVLCKKLPKIILPPLLFSNADYGIEKIYSSALTLELLSYKKGNEDKRFLQFGEYFKKQNLSVTEYDFFEN